VPFVMEAVFRPSDTAPVGELIAFLIEFVFEVFVELILELFSHGWSIGGPPGVTRKRTGGVRLWFWGTILLVIAISGLTFWWVKS
jgi:hypothetical protein